MVIKISASFIISPLTYICNVILKNGTFPERLKYAMVIPKLKKGNQHEVSNYRPISLLTSFSKIVEKTMFKRLLSHLEKKITYWLRSNSDSDHGYQQTKQHTQ